MSRCTACDKILLHSEMYTREITIDDKTVEVLEDICMRCRRVILDIPEEDLEGIPFTIIKEDYYED